MIENPIVETRQYLEEASSCRVYFYNKHTQNMSFVDYLKWEKDHPNILGVKLEDKIFNTRERIQQRFRFNEACSGKIFNGAEETIDACRINIDELGE